MKTNWFPAALLGVGLGVSPAPLIAEDISAECRGVAAGIVASMRAASELPDEAAVASAIIAARRGCEAAREGLGAAVVDNTATAQDTAATEFATEETSADEPGLWDMLTGTRERKPGNERLRRLKTQ